MKEVRPPRLAQKLFDWFCNDAVVEDLRGDMEELFYVNAEKMSVQKAKWKYWMHTLSLVTSYAVRKRKKKTTKFSSTEYSMDMLKSYFLIATRSLAKHKFFTIINVIGLAIGMSISLLLIAMISYVVQYDEFHVNKDRIYRVITQTDIRDNWEFASAPEILAQKIDDEYSGVEKVVRIRLARGTYAEYGNKQIPMEGFFVDPVFFETFTFPLVKGNVATALSGPKSMLITEAGAELMFGTEDPIGKVIKLPEFGEFEINGILKNPPKNSHMQFEFIVSYQAIDIINSNLPPVTIASKWTSLDNSYVYLLLPDAASENEPENLTVFMNNHAKKAYTKDSEFRATFDLQPLTSIVPGPDLHRAIGPAWDFVGLSVFGVLTLLILLPACFNYTNISISRALKRSKEIGLRKVVGGQRNQIFFQFILETVIVTLLALGVAYLFFTIIEGEFSSMMVASEFLDLTPTPITFLYFVGFAVLVGLIAGAVPALYFSKLNPIQALKSKSSSKVSKGSFLRKSLVVGQFSLSLGFIMAVGITAKQHIATLNYNFGFTQENILDVDLQGVDPNIVRNEFSKLSSVQNISMSSGIMGASAPSNAWIQKSEAKDSIEVLQTFVDHNYIGNLELTLLAGKSFPDVHSDREHFIIVNEEFLKQFELSSPLDAIGKTFNFLGTGELEIIGVAKNFHYADLRMPIQPFIFRYDPNQFNYANLKVTSTDMHTSIAEMEAVWKTIGGEKKFEATFFDDMLEDAYSVYYSMIQICGFLGFLAITISCLGLLGMVVYTAETRTKEIGVRKVMGASTPSIAYLLSKDYVKLMIIATIIATPLTYYFFDTMVFGSQSYRIPIGALEIIASILLMFLLGIGTILSQTLKASKANPVDTLRYE